MCRLPSGAPGIRMATIVEAPIPPKQKRSRRERRNDGGSALSTYGLLAPMLILLSTLFLLPMYYIVLFSIALKRFSPTDALASLNGELNSLSAELWAKLLSVNVTVMLPGLNFNVPVLLVGIIFLVLLVAAVTASRIPEYGNWIVGIAFVLLLTPFMTLPAGNNLLRLVELTSDGDYLRLFFKSVSMAMTSSVIAVVIAIPVAYFLAFCVGKSKYTWLLIVIAPFLTSYLLRIFAWKVILGDQGLINSGLIAIGLVDEASPLSFLIYSQFTVIVVLTYAWVPFICLPIFLAFETIDRRLLEAAMDLGATRLQAFLKISLPIIAPGIVAAFLFVFIPSIGEYITPSLVGGTQGTMYGQSLASQFVGGAFNWQFGSVMALFLLGVVLLITFATARFLRAGGGGL